MAFRPLLLLLWLSLSHPTYFGAVAWNETAPEFRLPRLEVQFVCGYDVRSTFNATNIFQDFYQKSLPGLEDIRLQTVTLEMSGMQEIQPQKWYYSSCNISSPQVLITLKLDGLAQFDLTTPAETTDDGNATAYNNQESIKEMTEQISVTDIEDYIGGQVCHDISFFRADVEDWSSIDPYDHEEMDQNLTLLCGELYSNDTAGIEPDDGFMLFGFLVGVIMIGMILSELRQFENRGSQQNPRSRRRQQRERDYYPTLETSELEMV